MPDDFAQFWPGVPLAREMNARLDDRSLGLTAKSDLERYYSLVRLTLAELRLTEAEASLIVCALYGAETHLMSQHQISNAVMVDSIGVAWEATWEVDRPALICRLGHSAAVSVALADAAERYWSSLPRVPALAHRERLVAAGLIVDRQPVRVGMDIDQGEEGE
jgi:hypothetical protein